MTVFCVGCVSSKYKYTLNLKYVSHADIYFNPNLSLSTPIIMKECGNRSKKYNPVTLFIFVNKMLCLMVWKNTK